MVVLEAKANTKLQLSPWYLQTSNVAIEVAASRRIGCRIRRVIVVQRTVVGHHAAANIGYSKTGILTFWRVVEYIKEANAWFKEPILLPDLDGAREPIVSPEI